MSDPRDPPSSRAVNQWNGSSNLPTIIYAPPPGEPSVTRGVTGLFVPIFLGIFIIVAIYFYTGAWTASQRLAQQQAVTRDTAGLLTYIEDLEKQNSDLCQRVGDLPERVERPNLQMQLETVRRDFDAQCRNNERIASRLEGDAAARCVAVTPPARSDLNTVRTTSGGERRETVSDFAPASAGPMPPALSVSGFSMSIDADTADTASPIVITHESSRTSIWVSIARAVVSFTLLAVLLLAFGVAIAGWFLQNSIKEDLNREIDRTPIQAHMVIAYRDALAELTERMSTERIVLLPPSQDEMYDRVLEDRKGRGATLNGAGAANLQEQLDLLQRDNADLRWANDQLRRQASVSRNPPLPRRNRAP